MKQRIKLPLIALFTISFLIACNGKKVVKQESDLSLNYEIGPVDTAGAVVGDWIIQRELADPQSLNPITLQDATGREFSLHVFERMLWAANRENYDLVPWLAEAPPEETPDHLTYTYKLKKNITFSNGKPLTGEDVVFTFKAALNPLVDAAQLRNAIDMVKNVELVNGDKYIIRFTLSK
ncbi:MAG TPA: ABC transporter substrate-binding protein, partial [Ignavibacteria bacterium]